MSPGGDRPRAAVRVVRAERSRGEIRRGRASEWFAGGEGSLRTYRRPFPPFVRDFVTHPTFHRARRRGPEAEAPPGQQWTVSCLPAGEKRRSGESVGRCERVTGFREQLLSVLQRVNSRLNPAYLEAAYQANYLDLSRRTPWLEEVPLASPTGGTASFTQLYVLLSVLREGTIQRALELGVGRSSLLFDQYCREFRAQIVHVDHDKVWLDREVTHGDRVTAIHSPLRPARVSGKCIQWYSCPRPHGCFDLVLIDGPPAWTSTSRFDRLGALNWIPEVLAPEHVLIIDDSNRPGERLLVQQVEQRILHGAFRSEARQLVGRSTLTVLATPKYQGFLYL